MKSNPEEMAVNHQDFILSSSSNPEDFGYDKKDVLTMLDIFETHDDHAYFYDENIVNDIGCFYENGVCTPKNIERAVYWYERAVKLGSDLAKSNLADILRKGTQGYPKDLKRSFELYKSCRLPYAFYRVGEFYENGWGCDKNIEKAKEYYRVAYREGHHLAQRKLQTFDFLH